MLRLIMRRGPTPGAIYELESDLITIGRGSKNHIVIRDNEVSREHCRLVRLMDDYEVQDLNSSNGTFVNGQRVVSNWLLQAGSIIELGDTITLEYERIDVSFEQSDETLLQTPNSEPLPSETSAQYCLMMTMGPQLGQVFPLDEVIITIGRDLSNDIVIQDPEVSRYHLRLRRLKQGYSVEDMGSTNGTYVNNVRLSDARPLDVDDVVKLGTMVRLQYIQQASGKGAQTDNPTPLGVRRNANPEFHQKDTVYTSENSEVVLSSRKTTRLGTGIEPGALEDHILIAYAREDWEALIASLTLSLQDAGQHVWVDQYLVQGSDDWRSAIEQALNECWMMVFVVSPRSMQSNYAKMQYRHFAKHDRPIIPLIYEDAKPLPPELSRARAITYDRENPRKSLNKLVFEIMQLKSS